MSNSEWMRRCLVLAAQAKGWTSPNPLVGAVVLDANGLLVSEGFHKGPGQWHAERDALLKVSGTVPNGTVFVNLEPCCVWGRTPPCTDIIIEKGIRNVYVGMLDPDPRMAGKGIKRLEEAGINVQVGLIEEECRTLNAAYLLAREQKRPLVTLKVASTLDGRVSDTSGQSKWITGEAARASGQRLRAEHDAILVGVGTVIKDDPQLNVRLENGPPIRPVILDTHLRTPQDAKIHTSGLKPWFYTHHASANANGWDVRTVPLDSTGLSFQAVLADLCSRDVYSVLVEGGASIASSILQTGLVDRLELFMAPKFLGGGLIWGDGLKLPLALASQFEIREHAILDQDIWLRLESKKHV
ncbi:MAG: bifunctional diaminohydroxyphosphoribosylaminopyrimidine deaminase/5-amino-6-(5-phosphoribosylamino)uracil reductase RibD [Myxococcota bacterium]